MGLLLILPLLVSGYIFCFRNPIIRFRLHRYEGQLLYLLVAYNGFICLLAALFSVAILSLLFSHDWPLRCLFFSKSICTPAFSTDYLALGAKVFSSFGLVELNKGQFYTFMILAGLGTLVAPYPLAWMQYRRYKKRLEKKTGEVVDYDIVDRFLLQSSVSHLPMLRLLMDKLIAAELEPVMISMADRKIYVGVVSSIGSPTEASGVDEDVAIWPLMSGYRDKDDLSVKFQNVYPDFDKSTSIPIYFKQKNIVSITPYDSSMERKVVIRKNGSTILSTIRSSPFLYFYLGVFAKRILRLAGKFLDRV
ncbi:hypothetical protein ACCQ12_15110 [Xanthomonas sp. NCPPB 1068]|uniref:hypothetical protein n=1 Tax=Xanthomonas sp. NCPPB 1068 TaxID=487525 RepID=UPI003558CD23